VSQDSRDARKGTRRTDDYLPERIRHLPLCKRDQFTAYAGTLRDVDTKHADELGAVKVVDCMMGNMDGTHDRIAFFKCPGTELYEVRRLPEAPVASNEGLAWRR
jgi:hypothetical protein